MSEKNYRQDLRDFHRTRQEAARPGMGSGVKVMVNWCPRPMLVLTGEEHLLMDNALLAYDGSPKAGAAWQHGI